jgi:Ca2+-binding RTX toxin-like protein
LADHLEVLKLQGSADIYAKGNAENNVIVGNSGANLIDGGLGVNKLTGGLGNDSYVLRRDYGLNTIQESANASGGVDQVQFGLGINSSQVWFSQVNNDLQATVIGTGARVLVKDWYSAGMSVESFTLSNGQQLAAANVQNLVNAMASLTPPAMGQTTLSAQQKSALNSVISNNWMTMSA